MDYMPRKKSLADMAARSKEASRCNGGRLCQTCEFDRKAEVEREARRFNRLRRERRTAASWRLLHAALVKHIAFPVRDARSLTRHLEGCLGWTLY